MHQNQKEVLMTKKDILDRWTEYIQKLFHDDSTKMPRITKNVTGPRFWQMKSGAPQIN